MICKGCGAEIKWIEMESGKNMPVDIQLETIVTDNGKIVKGYKSHFATCPSAKKYRRKS